eukprot:2165022-Amphidinium_carterae.1
MVMVMMMMMMVMMMMVMMMRMVACSLWVTNPVVLLCSLNPQLPKKALLHAWHFCSPAEIACIRCLYQSLKGH